MQRLLTFFQQKYCFVFFSDINIWKFNETVTNHVVSFKQSGPGLASRLLTNFHKHETSNADKCKNIKKFGYLLGSDKPRMYFSYS